MTIQIDADDYVILSDADVERIAVAVVEKLNVESKIEPLPSFVYDCGDGFVRDETGCRRRVVEGELVMFQDRRIRPWTRPSERVCE